MRLGGFWLGFSFCLLAGSAAMGQPAANSARIETSALRLMEPDPYQVAAVLEPVRRIKVVAPLDGQIRSVDARLGAGVRESQELVQFDPSEGIYRVQIAGAEVKAKKAATPISQADVEAAQARADLAQFELKRYTVRAPFAGRIMDIQVYPGQYVLKGTTLVELADTSSLRAVLPVDRRSVATGSTITVPVEEQEVSGKVQAILPLPESFAVLRELATPFAAASVVFPNSKGQLDAGLRARPAGVPTTAIANIPRRAIRPDDLRGAAGSMVQVIRNEYVTNVPVHVLGGVGAERVQVSGAFRPRDALILGSSVPLVPGTLVRFHEAAAARGIETTSPDPAHGGNEAGLTPPGSFESGGERRTGTAVPRRASPPVPTQAGGAAPF
jgi:multidrug efflux pump subunit AcrA (membrane-fusion protein)